MLFDGLQGLAKSQNVSKHRRHKNPMIPIVEERIKATSSRDGNVRAVMRMKAKVQRKQVRTETIPMVT